MGPLQGVITNSFLNMVSLRQADEVMSSGGESAIIAPTATADTEAAASANQVTTAASLRLDDFDDGQPLVWQAAERTITPMFEIAAANSTAPTSASVSKSNSELSVRYAGPTTSRYFLSRRWRKCSYKFYNFEASGD